MKYQAIFCDFDGTLYRSNHTISERNRAAIAAYTAAGGKFVIATGRLFSSIRPHLRELGLTGDAVVKQGAGVYDIESGARKWARTFDFDQALGCARAIDADPAVAGMVYIDDDCYAASDNEYVRLFARICGIEMKIVGGKLAEFLRPEHAIFKFIALVDARGALEKEADFCAALPETSICRSSDNILEFLPKGVSKGEALGMLCARYGISAREAIAVGDSENDISMIAAAGLGIAVGNAYDCVKSAADLVTVSNDEDAVAEIIEKYAL